MAKNKSFRRRLSKKDRKANDAMEKWVIKPEARLPKRQPNTSKKTYLGSLKGPL